MDIRFDSIKMPKMTPTKEGYLRGEAIVSRAGVFKYRNADGSIRGELRHPKDVFKNDSLDTLKMIPITNDHPPEFVNAENIHKYQVGYTGEHYDVRNDMVLVSMTVTHQDAIEAIKAGKLELSMGYEVQLQPEEGIYEGQNYDARQLEPKYNHLAIVEKGRAGSEARLRFDNASELITDAEHKKTIFIRDKEEEMTEDESKKKTDSLVSELNEVKAELLKACQRADKAELELQKEKEQKLDSIIEEKVTNKLALLTKSAPVLGDITKHYDKSDNEIMRLVISTLRGDQQNFEGKSEDYVRGVFEATLESEKYRKNMNKDNVYAVINRNNSDGSDKKNFNQIVAEHLHNQFSNLDRG